MTDSTHPARGAEPRLRRRHGRLDRCSNQARTALAEIVDDELSGLVAALVYDGGDSDGPEDGGSGHVVDPRFVQIVEDTGLHIVEMARRGRLPRRVDLIPFRFLGTECAHAGLRAEDVGDALDGAAEAILDLVVRRAPELECRWPAATVEMAVAAIAGGIETFSRFAYDELQFGYLVAGASGVRPRPEQVTLVCRALDRRGTGVGLDDEAAAVQLNPIAPRMLVLVAHRGGGHLRDLDRAAGELARHLPRTIDAGLGDELPAHRRFVLEQTTREAWDTACGVLRDIAIRYDLIAVTHPPVASVSALRTLYREALSELPTLLANADPDTWVVDARDALVPCPLIPPSPTAEASAPVPATV
jgi:hypothetical protein